MWGSKIEFLFFFFFGEYFCIRGIVYFIFPPGYFRRALDNPITTWSCVCVWEIKNKTSKIKYKLSILDIFLTYLRQTRSFQPAFRTHKAITAAAEPCDKMLPLDSCQISLARLEFLLVHDLFWVFMTNM